MRALGVVLILCLAGCGESGGSKPHPSPEFSQKSLAGRWSEDSQLRDRRVLSEMVVDAQGGYILHLTNILSDGVRTATLAGTLQIQDGQLVDTITNNFGGSTRVPRVASIMKIVRIDEHELVLSDTNSSTEFSYKRSSP